MYTTEQANENRYNPLDSTSDNALMLKVKHGDLDKLGLLFERYNRRLFGFFYRLTSRRDISEDLVQGVFERILRYRHTYSADGAFSTWIFQIARNLQADHYRETERRGETPDDPGDLDSLRGEDINQDLRLESESTDDYQRRWLKAALDRLDPVKKETLILSRYQGFTYREIAEIMDCTESAVKVRVFRGLNDLKEMITKIKEEQSYD